MGILRMGYINPYELLMILMDWWWESLLSENMGLLGLSENVVPLTGPNSIASWPWFL